jgi:hypothetical protein
MEKEFYRWNLDVSMISMMFRDSGSNMVNAGTDWGIPHFPCVGHCLHLIVGPLLVEEKKKPLLIMIDSDKESIDDTEMNEDVDATDDAFEDPVEIWSSQECLARVCSVVDDFRKAAVFLRISSKCKELLSKIQVLQSIQNLLLVKQDVRTRWNSTYHMLKQMD